jgi:hypothetical protein
LDCQALWHTDLCRTYRKKLVLYGCRWLLPSHSVGVHREAINFQQELVEQPEKVPLRKFDSLCNGMQ